MAIQIEDFNPGSDAPLAGPWPGGDRDRFEAAYESYHDRIFRFCRYRLGDAHEAEDVTQEAFTRAWNSRTILFEEQRLYPWLRVVAGNLCTDVLRRRGRCQATAEIDLGSEDRIEADLVRSADVSTLRQAMGRLNQRHREALEQREHAGWTYEQIADHAGTTVASVESLLWRARQALKREFIAIAGRDGMLAGVPVLGLAVRAMHRAKDRMARWSSSTPTLPATLFANSMAASLMGSTAAVVVGAAVGVLGPAQVSELPLSALPTTAHAVVSPPQPAPRLVNAAGKAPAPHSTASVAGLGPVNPPVYTSKPNSSDDRSMPVHFGVGSGKSSDTVGISPSQPAAWAVRFTEHHVIQNLQRGATR